MITPIAVPALKAIIPSNKIPKVFICKNDSAESLDPTVKPSAIVTILIKALRDVSAKRSTTPLSRIKLPKANMPTKGAASGNNKPINKHNRSEEHTSELQSRPQLVCRLL